MPYVKKKKGQSKAQKTRINPVTGKSEEYTVLVDLYEEVWEDDSSSYSDGSSYDSSSYDSGSSSSWE